MSSGDSSPNWLNVPSTWMPTGRFWGTNETAAVSCQPILTTSSKFPSGTPIPPPTENSPACARSGEAPSTLHVSAKGPAVHIFIVPPGQPLPQLPPKRIPTVTGMNLTFSPVVKTSWNLPSTNSPTLPALKSNPAPAFRPNLVVDPSVEVTPPTVLAPVALMLYTPPPPMR